VYHELNYLPLSYNYKYILTVHDISFVRYPEAHPVDRVRALEKFPEALNDAAAIITDSNFTANELITYYSIDTERIIPIKLGVNKCYHPRSLQEVSSCLDRYNLVYQNYILVVGTLEPRKNLQLVIDAYRSLSIDIQSRYPLVIIGMKGWGIDKLMREQHKLISSGKLRLLGYVTSDDLSELYSGSKLFVYPSIYEGFGLPPLEAMASGVPVITTNCSSLPEIVGNAGVQIDQHNVHALCDVIEEILDDNVKTDKMIQRGILQAKSFSWEKCATSVVDVYKSIKI